MMKLKIIFCFLLFGICLILPNNIFAQNASPAVGPKSNISYPIPELGNCSDISQCRIYCDDPLHQEACLTFAKQKGIYKESSADNNKETILSVAKKELNCESQKACMTMCGQPENYDKCSSFATKVGLNGGYVKNPEKKQILEKAKEVLGCFSVDSCKTFCEQNKNNEACSTFAQQVGLRGGIQTIQQTDKKTPFCEEYPDRCNPTPAPTASDNRTPFCKEYPDRCNLTSYPTATSYPIPTSIGEKKIGIDGTWCFDSDRDKRGGLYDAQRQGYCQDQVGTYQDYCADTIIVRDYYCTWTSGDRNVHCADGGYTCSGVIGNGCANGACKPPSSSSPSPTPIVSNPTTQPTTTATTPTPVLSTPTTQPTTTATTPTPVLSTPTTQPTSSNGDGSFCEDSDANGGALSSGTCTDANGIHSDYCEGSIVRDWYCTGSWNGSSWSNRHCEAGGYDFCTSSGKSCSNGACVSGSVEGLSSTNSAKNILQTLVEAFRRLF